MKKMLSLVYAAALLVPCAVQAQVGGGRVEDVASLDGILDAYYEVVSRPVGTAPDRERDEWIHHPDALVAITGLGADGARGDSALGKFKAARTARRVQQQLDQPGR